MSTSAVLVVAEDVVIGALLASMAELAGYTPIFPKQTERALEAITRLRPPLVLLDCAHNEACEDEAYARAAEVGSKVILFSAMHTRHEAEQIAAKRGVPAFVLPIRFHELAEQLERVRPAPQAVRPPRPPLPDT
jgi:DNA-binding NtrC family response regulator